MRILAGVCVLAYVGAGSKCNSSVTSSLEERLPPRLTLRERHNSADITHCLADPSTNDTASLQCERQTYPLSCLSARIPWFTNPRRVRHCFHCCLNFWMRELGLARRYQEIDASSNGELRVDKGFSKSLTHIRQDSVLIDQHSMNKLAHALPKGMIGIFFEAASMNREDLSERTVCLFAAGFKPLRLPVTLHTAHQRQGNNPRTAQLNPNVLILANNFHVTRPKDVSLNRVIVMPRGLKSGPKKQGGHPWEDAASFLPANQKPESIPNCCCMQKKFGRESKLADLVARRVCDPTPLNAIYGAEYLAHMNRHRFQFSPVGSNRINFRDHEAIIAGQIPLLSGHGDLSTGTNDNVDETIESGQAIHDLYNECPVVWASSWSELSLECLDEKFDALMIAAAADREEQRWHMTKFYLPYWLFVVFDEIRKSEHWRDWWPAHLREHRA